MRCYPGSVIEITKQDGKEFIDNIFAATSGLVLSQITELTGVLAPTVQNWVSRGWLSRPKAKKYGKDQTARILIINLLRATMSLENISKLLYYLNGDPEDLSDEVVPESVLYGYIFSLTQAEEEGVGLTELSIGRITGDYTEKISGAKERLNTALMIIGCEYSAGRLLERSQSMLSRLSDKNILGK